MQGILNFSVLEFIRFVVLHLITAPLNYKWQELLEATFPAYQYDHAPSKSIRFADDDVEKRTKEATLDNEEEIGGTSRRLNYRNTITKWFVDAITLGALFNASIFFVIMGIFKGQTLAKIKRNLRTKLIVIIVNGYKVWPLVSIISFSLVPVKHRIQFFSAVGLFWNIYGTIVAVNL